jgi:hypothetical protein
MREIFTAIVILAALGMPASAELTTQQQKMKDCNTQASGMSGDARKQFMSSCLSGGQAETKDRAAQKGSRVAIPASAMNKVCHK